MGDLSSFYTNPIGVKLDTHTHQIVGEHSPYKSTAMMSQM